METRASNEAEADYEWVDFRFCHSCRQEIEHQYIQWRDEPVVTATCLACDRVDLIEDWNV